ncbi:hypothetical protein I553_10287 [Mycobacterium xenopi 4042]|uniref:Uncharacterized protein n=1 Tax=Mycobacterium xenopi 4042 TaxID=1299334 RepID=X8ANB8_MYCXE|nr:hypothetical protein I553_10287 [Mycobacterium xenopi 4042]
MIGAGSVEGRALSHPDHDRIWSAFVEHGITRSSTSPIRCGSSTIAGIRRPVGRSGARHRSGVPMGATGAGVDRSDLAWCVRPSSATPFRRGGAQLGVGAPVFAAARRRVGLHHQAQRQAGGPAVAAASEYFLEHVRVSSFSYEDPSS